MSIPGIGESYRKEVRERGYSEREWSAVLLDEHDSWMRTMEQATEENAQLLFWTQALLGFSLTSLFFAITLLAIGR